MAEPADNVIQLDSHRPHRVVMEKCSCGHEQVAVAPCALDVLVATECSKCRQMTALVTHVGLVSDDPNPPWAKLVRETCDAIGQEDGTVLLSLDGAFFALPRGAAEALFVALFVALSVALGGKKETDRESIGVPTLAEAERTLIRRAMKLTKGSVGRAAKLLGIGRATLYRRLAAFDQFDRSNFGDG